MNKKRIKRQNFRVPNNNHEIFLHARGFNFICGVDEVGRGAWAGPLVAGAVILDRRLYGLRDSKLLDSKKREVLAKKIRKFSKVGIGEVSAQELNKLKLTKGTHLAFNRAIKALRVKPDFILIDGPPSLCPERARTSRMGCRALIKGDRICSSIAAASIIAKVYRDKLMRKLDKEVKGYNFSSHKGYGTKEHMERLKNLGPSKAHRMFYKSLK
ncbi:MAG: Ribonuclease ribonuclease [Candidatus Berkelbacteria bacterium]|nr:Ribonuclease ribonuclease [Candidatus Berkelbacteria bacterium]